MSTDRTPHDPQAEAATIGCLLLDSSKVMPLALRDGVNPASFYVLTHRQAWEAIARLYSQSSIVDSVTLAAALRVSGGLDRIGGQPQIDAWIDAAMTIAHAEHYIAVIRAAELKRAGIELARRAQAELMDIQDADLPAAIARIQADWCRVEGQKQDTRSLYELATGLLEEWAAPLKTAGMVRWPLRCMDENIMPLTDELVYIAARESVGKTALAVQMAVQLGFAGVPVAFASLESKRVKIVQRMIAMIGRCDTLAMRAHAKQAQLDYGRAVEAVEKIKRLPISISDSGMTIDQVRAFGQMEKARGARLLIVDNMKHIRATGSNRGKSTVEQFREMAQALKWMRDDLDLPVIVLHHLNKDGDVSWSDDIRRDADILLFLNLNEQESTPYTPQNQWRGRTIVDIDVEKSRDGRRGYALHTEFLPKHQTFVEMNSGGQDAEADRPY
jgi:replicative DNA helicase